MIHSTEDFFGVINQFGGEEVIIQLAKGEEEGEEEEKG